MAGIANKSQHKRKPTRAEINIAWCEEHLRIPEGKFVGQPLKMAEFMREDFRAIFDNQHGTRRAIISRGRKNAKTVETAILMLIYLCGPEAKPNSQLYSAARSRDQAAVLFNLAAKMVRLSNELSAVLIVRDTAKEIFCPELGSKYKALSAEASTAFGLSPRFLAHDELGQVRGPRDSLYEALETATAAQDDPLSVIISTQSTKPSDLLSVLIDDAMTGSDPRTVLRFQTAPLELDTFSEEAIRAANPAFDVFMNKTEVLAMAADASRMPSRQSEFENLVLNRRVESNSPFVSRGVWQENGDAPEPIDGCDIYGGLDLSSVNDLTALVLMHSDGERWNVNPTFWLPENGLFEKSKVDRVPYDLWADQGHLNTTPGASIQYDFVAEFLRDIFDRCNVIAIAFDRYNMRFLKPCLERKGFSDQELEKFIEFGQGFVSMSPALRETESLLLNGKLKHGNHPVLSMCAANATTLVDSTGNRKFMKAKATGRIDGMVALAQAVGVMPTEIVSNEKSFWEVA